MGFYKDQIVPLLINPAMRQKRLATYRSPAVHAAQWRVLEIGIGSGLNLPFNTRNVEHLIGPKFSPKLLAMTSRTLRGGSIPVGPIESSAEATPLNEASVGGGCHLSPAIKTLIETAGFQFDRIDTGYMQGPKPTTFIYEGGARPR